MDLLKFYNAEFLWPYITGEKDIPRNDAYTDYYRSARDFGRLCATTSLEKASSNPSHRPIDYEFVDIYNGITKAILANLELGEIEKGKPLSMKKLEILAEYMTPVFTDIQAYKRGLRVVLEGDITDVYTLNEEIVSEENRKRIIGLFGGSLVALTQYFGIDEVKKVIGTTVQYGQNSKIM